MADLSTKEKRIIEYLKKGSATIEEVSKNIGYSRATVSKYLSVLEAKGIVVLRKIGKAKLYSLKEVKGDG
ncbi:MAG: winged helix-turn-helix domain-containing protein [Candidatus Woesearchaeota archaeon]